MKNALTLTLPTGGLELLVLQASPFCNLDCSYCYLPDRNVTARMPLPLLDRVLQQVAASGLVGTELGVVWHAGEPMAVPRRWYEAAFETIARRLPHVRLTHHFQTNAVLIDAAWCSFFARHGVRVGVSIDGPAPLHDRHRRSRDGHGSHARVMAGIAQLQQAGIGFHAIAVLTRDSLAQADALFQFFAALGAEQVGFNIEEIESEHRSSSLQPGAEGSDDDPHATRAALHVFWARFMQLLQAHPGAVQVREIGAVLGALRDPGWGHHVGNMQNQAGRMLNVAHDGSWCFWSPELLGARHPLRGSVTLGNLAHDPAPWQNLAAAARWQREIDAGVRQCRERCAYFNLCLGGAPANKLAENGSMAGSETMACRLGVQAVAEVVLAGLEETLGTPRRA